MPELTPETLESLKDLEAKATPGPLFSFDCGIDQYAPHPEGNRVVYDGGRDDTYMLLIPADFHLFAALRNHAASLIELAGEALAYREAEKCPKCNGVTAAMRGSITAFMIWKPDWPKRNP